MTASVEEKHDEKYVANYLPSSLFHLRASTMADVHKTQYDESICITFFLKKVR